MLKNAPHSEYSNKNLLKIQKAQEIKIKEMERTNAAFVYSPLRADGFNIDTFNGT